MRIEVAKINDEEISLTETVAASVWAMDSFDVQFTGNININCRIIRITKEIMLKAKVTAHQIISCSRCFGQAKHDIDQDVSLNYNVDELGKYLEPDEDIRQEILLNFPMKVLCKPDCKGVCPRCGINLNREECKCSKVVN